MLLNIVWTITWINPYDALAATLIRTEKGSAQHPGIFQLDGLLFMDDYSDAVIICMLSPSDHSNEENLP